MSNQLDQHGFKHIYKPGADEAPPLLLLHGTGGTEQDLVPLANLVSPESAILSIRGKIVERGMHRFFRRFAEGVFDIEDIKFRTRELLAFIKDASDVYGMAPGSLVILGYSNGANIGTSLLLTNPSLFTGGILMRPMVLHELEEPVPDLNGKRLVLLGGELDSIAPPSEVTALAAQYQSTGASVDTRIHYKTSHGLSQADIDAAREFLG